MSQARRSFAVVPAAGRSTRMGRPKLLMPWGGSTVIEHVLAAWRASRVQYVIATVHPDDQRLAETCRRAGAEVVVATPPPPDMKASVTYGLAHIGSVFSPSADDAWLLAPADMPRLAPGTIDAVLDIWRAGFSGVVVPRHAGRRGHPVLFSWAQAAEVTTLGPDEGLNSLLARHPVREIDIADDGTLVDVDTPEDYRRWHRRS